MDLVGVGRTELYCTTSLLTPSSNPQSLVRTGQIQLNVAVWHVLARVAAQLSPLVLEEHVLPAILASLTPQSRLCAVCLYRLLSYIWLHATLKGNVAGPSRPVRDPPRVSLMGYSCRQSILLPKGEPEGERGGLGWPTQGEDASSESCPLGC